MSIRCRRPASAASRATLPALWPWRTIQSICGHFCSNAASPLAAASNGRAHPTRSFLAQRLPARVGEARAGAAAEAPLVRREQRDDADPVARVERFLRLRQHVAHAVGVHLAAARGDQIVPELRLVVEEAPAAAAQDAGEAAELGAQQLGIEHRVVEAVDALRERLAALDRVQLLDRERACRRAADLEVKLEPERRDRERDLAAAFGVDPAGAVDHGGMHTVAVAAALDRAARADEAVLVDEEAKRFLLACAERLVEGHGDTRRGRGSAIVCSRPIRRRGSAAGRIVPEPGGGDRIVGATPSTTPHAARHGRSLSSPAGPRGARGGLLMTLPASLLLDRVLIFVY